MGTITQRWAIIGGSEIDLGGPSQSDLYACLLSAGPFNDTFKTH